MNWRDSKVGGDGGAALPRAARLMMMKQIRGADFDINTCIYVYYVHRGTCGTCRRTAQWAPVTEDTGAGIPGICDCLEAFTPGPDRARKD